MSDRKSCCDAVFFDVGNTLLYPYPSVSVVVEEILREAGHVRDLEAIEQLMPVVDEYYEDRYRADDTFWTDDAGAMDVWVGMYTLLCRRLGLDQRVAPVLARAVYDAFGEPERWRAYDDVRPAFERLRAAGVKVGIISNWDTRLERIFAGLGLLDLVDVIVSSAAVGLHKPDPRIFLLACARVGVEPGSCAHVGDHYYADVLGARVVGMWPVLIDRHGVGCPISVACIESLEDLEVVIS
ncbi:MAG: HAD-IA family hydrolase [Coriobacteriia bacterium]|nr:HAD-IA family hydrolase [Coriobacteriia bacterium]